MERKDGTPVPRSRAHIFEGLSVTRHLYYMSDSLEQATTSCKST